MANEKVQGRHKIEAETTRARAGHIEKPTKKRHNQKMKRKPQGKDRRNSDRKSETNKRNYPVESRRRKIHSEQKETRTTKNERHPIERRDDTHYSTRCVILAG